MNTTGRRGRLVKSVTVYSNDPAQPRLALKIQGTVEVIVAFDPASLSLREVAAGSKVTHEVKLVGKRVADLRLRNIRSDHPAELRARLTRVAGGPALAVTFRPGKEPRSFNGLITADTGLDDPRTLQLRVWAYVTGDLQVLPRYVAFPPFDAKRHQQRTLRVRSAAGRAFAIRAVKDAAGVVRGQAAKQGKVWQITLHITKEAPRSSGTIELQTDRKDQPVIRVPYSVSRMGTGLAAHRAAKLLRRPSVLRALIPPKKDGSTPMRPAPGKRGPR